MMTIGEENAVREIKRASIRFSESVEKLIKLEAMKAGNVENPGKYKEEDFLKLIQQ